MELLTLIARLHENTYARIRWGSQGQVTRDFMVERGVRQGCVMAPTLFSLYINGLVDFLNESNVDAPILAGIKIPALLFADDTLILSKTPSGLQKALGRFEAFCNKRGLEINTAKTKLMVFDRSKKFKGKILVQKEPLEQVSAFTYLGINIQNNFKWVQQISMAALKHRQHSGALLAEFRSSLTRPIAPLLCIYEIKVVSSALYGAELWGCNNLNELTLSENRFLRGIANLPQSTPMLPLKLDLGRNSIKDIARLRPVLYWRRVWTTPELAHYADGLAELIRLDGGRKIIWLGYVRDTLRALGLDNLWRNPSVAIFPSKNQLKKQYWEWVLYRTWKETKSTTFAGMYLDIKAVPSLEDYWDLITTPGDRKLYFQLRVGTLPLRSYTARWSDVDENSCPICNLGAETISHILFVCPAYIAPRRTWLSPMCATLGTKSSSVAKRLICTSFLPLIGIATAKFLGRVWTIRRKKFPPPGKYSIN